MYVLVWNVTFIHVFVNSSAHNFLNFVQVYAIESQWIKFDWNICLDLLFSSIEMHCERVN